MSDGCDASALLAWFQVNARDLPWRGPFPRDPYRVLVSEVMLQQTQVDRVVEPYRRFLERFPSLETLAAAPLEDVLHAFSGLGYYRRARNLHAAAASVVAMGGWPRDREGLAALPGFGPYTSAAVAAFAFAGADPPVDGNIERVAARLGAVAERVASTNLRRRAVAMALEMHRQAPVPDLYEALMELGARVCTPSAPDCRNCPLASDCLARRTGTVHEVPLARRTRSAESHRWVALWVQRPDGRVLLSPVPGGSMLDGLYLPPLRFAVPDGDHAAASELAAGVGFRGVELVGEIRHGITHRRITVAVYRADSAGAAPAVGEPRPGTLWADPENPSVPTSSLLGKISSLVRGAAAGIRQARARARPPEGQP